MNPPSTFALHFDPASRRLRVGQVSVTLSPKEAEVLALFSEHAGAAVSRADLAAALWPEDPQKPTTAVEMYVSKLRRKLRTVTGDGLIRPTGRGYLVPACLAASILYRPLPDLALAA